jgi:endonuclease/exonuclease/phosphatase family metal-dependent hydrolase
VRVATWNIQSLGAVGSEDYTGVEAVLRRLNPDVVGFNEVVDVDLDDLRALAEDLGYLPPIVAESNPFGEQRQAILTRLTIEESSIATSAQLSGDNGANDVTRNPVFVQVAIPGHGSLRVVSEHWKSGEAATDQFRRTVDGLRVAQAVKLGDRDAPVMAMGDVNAELGETPTPTSFHSAPSDLPGSYSLGDDLDSRMDAEGLANDQFAAMADVGLQPLDALQLDGRNTTRPESGRRIDYLFLDADLRTRAAAEVYDSLDESIGGGLPKAGDAPARGACGAASDHLPVLVDLTFSD